MGKRFTANSKEAKKKLKITDCKLMHLRESGILRATKKGRSYYYHEDDIERYSQVHNHNKSRK